MKRAVEELRDGLSSHLAPPDTKPRLCPGRLDPSGRTRSTRAALLCGLGLVWLLSQSALEGEPAPALGDARVESNGWIRVRGSGPTNQVFSLQASTNLTDWTTIALLDGRSREPE